MAETFLERLRTRARDVGPLCVGVDPSRTLMLDWGRGDDVGSIEFFSLLVLESVVGTAVAIKPQVAYYERFGAAGYRVLERLLAEARDADVLIVGDAKRGDIGSTNDGYAEAWLGDESPLRVDAVTASPFLGVDALAPLYRVAGATGRGVFVLAATSNDEGREIQRARTDTGERVEESILRHLRELNERDGTRGAVGAVLGATRERPHFDLATLGGPYLVPGVGAQGAGAADVGQLFERVPAGSVLVNVGRAILGAGPDKSGLRDRARRWRDDLVSALL